MKKLIYAGVLLLASLAPAQSQEAHIMDTEQQDGAVVQQLIDRHFDLWNAADPAQRAPHYPGLYAATIFVADYAGIAVGYTKVEQKIADLQGKHAGFKFRPQPATWNHGIGRVTWSYGPGHDPDLVRGEDIFTIDDGKLASLRVFIDKK